jgi:hypothetical protein
LLASLKAPPVAAGTPSGAETVVLAGGLTSFVAYVGFGSVTHS